MNIHVYDRESYTKYRNVNERWLARLLGPWYEDSAPEGRGATEQEAKANLMKEVVELRDELTKFIEAQVTNGARL